MTVQSYNHRKKVLGHFCISRAFSNSHRSNPSPSPTNNVGRVYPEFFQSFTVYEGTQKWQKNMNIFPRTFVLDCSLPINFGLIIRIVLQIRQMWLLCGVNTTKSFLRPKSFLRESAEINQPRYHSFWRQKLKVVTWRERIRVKKSVGWNKVKCIQFLVFFIPTAQSILYQNRQVHA